MSRRPRKTAPVGGITRRVSRARDLNRYGEVLRTFTDKTLLEE
jgi:hypothetical protein